MAKELFPVKRDSTTKCSAWSRIGSRTGKKQIAIKRHYRDSWWNVNINCRLVNSIASMFVFVIFMIALWFCKTTMLFFTKYTVENLVKKKKKRKKRCLPCFVGRRTQEERDKMEARCPGKATLIIRARDRQGSAWLVRNGEKWLDLFWKWNQKDLLVDGCGWGRRRAEGVSWVTGTVRGGFHLPSAGYCERWGHQEFNYRALQLDSLSQSVALMILPAP